MHRALPVYAPPAGELRVVHADDALIVADKPAGLLAVPGRGADKADCLAARVQRDYPDALIVHRLDMATSGLIAFARDTQAQRLMSIAFARREVHKRYVALVAGHVADDGGRVELPLICDWPNRPRQKVDSLHGKPSMTLFRVLERDDRRRISRVELEPVTGRSHQLRVHMAAIGHPIVGDRLYAGADTLAEADRLMLHACELELTHPTSGARLRFASPADF